MSCRCFLCRFFDDTETSLPTCLLLRRFTQPSWSCADFEER